MTSADEYPYDLGSYSRAITCQAAEAQRWFDRGMIWTFGFHHEEAIKCFEEALKYDACCAMAYWGVAYCHGPNYNFNRTNGYLDLGQQEIGFPSMKLANAAIFRAEELVKDKPIVERELIEALKLRCIWPAQSTDTANFATKEIQYSQAMTKLYREHPEDADITFFLADSLMLQKPWQLWNLQTGEPAEVVPELLHVLESGISLHPNHPGLCHLYIHALEMSPDPGRALSVGDRLRTLSPDNPHLCHMPSHIDMLVGNFTAAIESNAAAIEGDRKLIAQGSMSGFFVGYAAHDYHMLVFAAMYAGQYEVAKSTAEALTKELVTHELLTSLPESALNGMEPFVPIILHVFMRFGQWEEILSFHKPKDSSLYSTTTATVHYCRAIALGVQGRLDDADVEQQLFEAARAAPAVAGRYLHNNAVSAILEVGAAVLRGELAYRRGDYELAYQELREAVSLDDSLVYDEPWGWMLPARHALGALLAEQGHHNEAISVYRQDLSPGCGRPGPNNPWALRGLVDSLRAISAPPKEVHEIEQRLAITVATADVEILASCACAKFRCDEQDGANM